MKQFLRYRMPGVTSLLNPLKRKLLGCSEGYTYRGMPMQKNPIDLAIYSMLLWDLKPETIIEIGSKDGGSAMWFSDSQKIFGRVPVVISVDINPPPLKYFGVDFIKGDARDLNLDTTHWRKPWLVIEDSAHTYEATLAVLRFFHRHVTKGDYIVVEDVHVAAVDKAVKDWLAHDVLFTLHRYQIDHHYQDFWGFSDHAYMKVV